MLLVGDLLPVDLFVFSFFAEEMNLWGLIAGGAMVLGPRPRGKKRSPEEDEDE